MSIRAMGDREALGRAVGRDRRRFAPFSLCHAPLPRYVHEADGNKSMELMWQERAVELRLRPRPAQSVEAGLLIQNELFVYLHSSLRL